MNVISLRSGNKLKQPELQENEDKEIVVEEEKYKRLKMPKEVGKPKLKLFPHHSSPYVPSILYP